MTFPVPQKLKRDKKRNATSLSDAGVGDCLLDVNLDVDLATSADGVGDDATVDAESAGSSESDTHVVESGGSRRTTAGRIFTGGYNFTFLKINNKININQTLKIMLFSNP